jgi:quercetin 2,3-dioxygenase
VIEASNGRVPLATFDIASTARDGTRLRLTGGSATARLVLYAGEPIAEPVFAYGPFIMASRADLMRVMEAYRAGKMGKVEPSVFGADGRPVAG